MANYYETTDPSNIRECIENVFDFIGISPYKAIPTAEDNVYLLKSEKYDGNVDMPIMEVTAYTGDAEYSAKRDFSPDATVIYFEVKTRFPDIDSRDFYYYDTYRYIMDKWEIAAGIATELLKQSWGFLPPEAFED